MKYTVKWRFWNLLEVWSRRIFYYASERCNKEGEHLLKVNEWPIVGTDTNIGNTDI
jgi:hypothetical protein